MNHRFTKREIEIINFITNGMTNREIAAAAGVSPSTVKTIMRNIFNKTGVRNKMELVIMFLNEKKIDQKGDES